jgi:hypothetical protein
VGRARAPVRNHSLGAILLRPQRLRTYPSLYLPPLPDELLRARAQSLIAQGSQFPLRKPGGFHYDFALLGVTTFLAGLLGVPAPNGLIPQAPIHTRALLVLGLPPKVADDEGLRGGSHDISEQPREVPVAVVEQRVSNLAQGSLCLVLLTRPFLHVLNLVPQGEYAVPSLLLLHIDTMCALFRRDRGPIVRDASVDRH